MAFIVGFDTENNREQLNEAIEIFEENLEKVNEYSYPDNFNEYRAQINQSWRTDKIFFNDRSRFPIPNLVLESIIFLEETLDKISLHHTKNQ